MELETSSLIEQEASIFNAIPIGIAIVVDGVLATVNKAMEEIFENISDIGHIKAGGLWMKYYSSIPWSSRIHFKQTEAKYYSASQELVFDNGEINRTFNVSSFAIDGTENGAIWIFQDNTFEKEKNIKIAQMHDIAEMESQRKSVFMANLSHDLRTPIHGILGILNSIQKNQYPHELQKKLQLLNHSAEYIQAVVDDGLDLSANDLGLGKDQLNIISIDSLIGKIKVLEEDKVVSKGLNFVIKKIAPPDVFIKIKVTKLLRVVCNLIDNAYKFTNSGSITVVLCLYNLNANSDLEIRIIDTGTGLRRGTDESDMQDDSDIQNVPSGYGLGMAIVNDLLKKLNGSMELVRSNSGGTEFMLHFPVAIHNPSATPRLSSAVIHDDPDNISMPSGLRILVAEDNRISRFVIEDQLNDIYSDCGVEISIVTNGREAFEKWQSWRPSIILMDIQMPVLDGEQAARKIRAAQQLEGNDTQAVILVATTAHTFIEEQQRLLYGDFDLMLTKPMTPDQLRSVLQHSVKKLKDLGLH
jgi:signal transduction histidine kinase/CheY-like chemotaxis protein